MATPSDISVGLAHELVITATKAGWESKDFADLAHNEEKLRRILQLIRGHAEIPQVQHIVDCDAEPLIPWGWRVEEHKKGGQFTLDFSKIRFYLSPNQQSGGDEGNKLRKELASKPALNANVLEYLLAHPKLIPEDWKRDKWRRTRYILFWGTIYRSWTGFRYVRCLCFCGGKWNSIYHWLGNGGDDKSPAALLAS